jgi:hypothetical protein
MRHPPQFTLGRLMALIGLLALPLSLAHYYLHGPEWLRNFIGLSLALLAACALMVALQLCLVGCILLIHKCMPEPSVGAGLSLAFIVVLLCAMAAWSGCRM